MVQIEIVLADDWELRGDGSGNMRALQFGTIRRLAEIYESCGLRGSFNAEVMQQLYHLRIGRQEPELATLATEWEETVLEIYSRGHDFQLHVHPQWLGAQYKAGRWTLGQRWSLADYSATEAREMLSECKDYLETLIQRVDREYRCLAYRGGSWFIAPSDHILPALAELGIVFDMTLAEGLFFDLPIGRLDYRDIEEPFLPFFPRMDDARKIASEPQPIICVPTHSFKVSGKLLLARIAYDRVGARGIPDRLREHFQRPNAVPIRDAGVRSDYREQWWVNPRERRQTSRIRNLWRYLTEEVTIVSDLSQLSFAAMLRMVKDIRDRARATGLPTVPIVLENHTKVIGDFRPFEKFARFLAEQNDLKVITSAELARKLRDGAYPIRVGSAGA